FRRQQWPLLDGAINVVSRPALEALRRNGYQLRAGTGKNRPVVPKWSDWVDVMLAEAVTDDPRMRGYPSVSNVIDGLLYEYRKDVKGLLSTGSISPRAAQSLAVASTDSGLLIASPQVRRELNAPSVQAGQQMFSPSDLSTEDTMFEELPQEARSIVEQRMAKWEGERGMSRRRQSPRAEARRGAPVREELARTNMMMRFLQLWYVFKTMLNPGLHVAAYLELAQKSTQERVV